eukprot:gene56563-75536_t
MIALGLPWADWLQTFPLFMVTMVNTWRGIGTAMILLTAGLSAVPAEVYEAARMDGASQRQTFMRITLPLMAPTIFLYMLISTVSTISVFGLVYALTRGGPGNATEVISVYIYNQSFTTFQLGYGAAGAVVALLISLVFVRTTRTVLTSIAAYATLIVISIFCLLPFIWMALASVDSNAKLFLKWPDSWTFDNYLRVFNKEDGYRWFANSLFTVTSATILVMIISGLGGYALSRSRAWWKQPFLYAVLLIRVLPST